MKVIAHRGACTEALENSWEAFYKAVDAGAERIELDVHLSKDGHLVIVHDEDFQRTAGKAATIASLTRREIERDIRLNNGEAVPFLDQVFTEFLSKIEFNVEIKSPGKPTAEAVAHLIEKQTLSSKIIVSSFMLDTCQCLAQDFPELRVALLWDKSLWWPGSFNWGPKRFMRKHKIKIFHPDARLVSSSLVHQIKAEGWEIFPYISLRNEQAPEELWSYLMTLGVDGHCTNYPRHLKLWLQEAADDINRFRSIRHVADRQS